MFVECKYVALFNIREEEVARGVVEKMGAGSIFSGYSIQKIDDILLVWSIKDESVHVHKMYVSNMGKWMDRIINGPNPRTYNEACIEDKFYTKSMFYSNNISIKVTKWE